jgi:hypothetical protein
VSVLTTSSTGVGARRRCTLQSGKDVIEQVSAWVEGLGYEYAVIEGGPYRSLRGRFRLQAGPDGTSVQWTIAYQPKGLFGLIKDRLGGRRAMAALMSASLRQLRREIDALGMRMDDQDRARVAIRRLVEERPVPAPRQPPVPRRTTPATAGAVRNASALTDVALSAVDSRVISMTVG